MNDPETKGEGLRANEFEQEVRQALRHVDAPEGFTARVLERAAATEMPLPWRLGLRHVPLRAWVGAVAAILLLTALVANQIRDRRERERVAKLQVQFDTAMRITDSTLEQTRAELERVGLKLSE